MEQISSTPNQYKNNFNKLNGACRNTLKMICCSSYLGWSPEMIRMFVSCLILRTLYTWVKSLDNGLEWTYSGTSQSSDFRVYNGAEDLPPWDGWVLNYPRFLEAIENSNHMLRQRLPIVIRRNWIDLWKRLIIYPKTYH